MKIILPLVFYYLSAQISLFSQVTPKTPVIQIEEDTDAINTITNDLAETSVRPFEYKVFPERVDSKLQIILPTTENFTMRLVDEDGNVLFSHYQIFGENQVNLGHLKAAKYFVELSCPRGKVVQEITKT